jgi:hypothetical protein
LVIGDQPVDGQLRLDGSWRYRVDGDGDAGGGQLQCPHTGGADQRRLGGSIGGALREAPSATKLAMLTTFRENNPPGSEGEIRYRAMVPMGGTVTLSSSRQLGESVSEHC